MNASNILTLLVTWPCRRMPPMWRSHPFLSFLYARWISTENHLRGIRGDRVRHRASTLFPHSSKVQGLGPGPGSRVLGPGSWVHVQVQIRPLPTQQQGPGSRSRSRVQGPWSRSRFRFALFPHSSKVQSPGPRSRVQFTDHWYGTVLPRTRPIVKIWTYSTVGGYLPKLFINLKKIYKK